MQKQNGLIARISASLAVLMLVVTVLVIADAQTYPAQGTTVDPVKLAARTDPTPIVNRGIVYAKGASPTHTELYYMDQMGTVTQITASGTVAPPALATAYAGVYTGADKKIVATAAMTDGQLLIGSTGNVPVAATITGTANEVEIANAAGSITAGLPDNVTVTSGVTISGNTASAFVYSDAAKKVATTGAPTDGQLLIGSTGAIPAVGSITEGTGITVTPGAGTITIAANVGAGVGTLCDIYKDGVLVLDDAEDLDFRTDVRTSSASGTAAKIPLLDTYDATFIVGSTANCTHTTLALAVAAITGPTLIRMTAETHTIAATVTLPSQTVAIMGAGPGTLLNFTGATGNVIETSTDATGAYGFHISDLRIDGNKAGVAAGSGILVQGYFHTTTISNVTVVDCKTDGIKFSSPGYYENAAVVNCEAYSCTGVGFNIAGGGDFGIRFANCVAAVCATGFACSASHATYSSCNADTCTTGFHYSGTGTRGVTYSSCTVTNGVTYGFRNENNASPANYTGCHVYGGAYGWHQATTYTVITGCTAQAVTQPVYASLMSGSIAGCTFIGIASSQHIIYLTSDSYVTVTGNKLSSLPTGANYDLIYITGSTARITIVGNLLESQSSKVRYAISENSNADYTTISGNKFVGTFATGEYLIIGANSRVLDPCAIQGEFSIASGASGAQTITGLGTGSCPLHFEFSAVDDSLPMPSAAIGSLGSDDGTYATCLCFDSLGAPNINFADSIYVQDGGNGQKAEITLLGAAGGTAQDQFVIDADVIGTGRPVKVRYKAWR